MTDTKIQPSAITKPMQLLAAWLVGLLAVDGSFLTTASHMPTGSMESTALVWAAIINVPIFLVALFLLQTKFRPELQEDAYYSTYINQKTNQTISITRDEQHLGAVLGRIERVENLIEAATIQTISRENSDILSSVSFGINEHLQDRDELSEKLLHTGIPRHTWFGGKEPPEQRVISISEHLPKQARDIVLLLAEQLGFTRYNLFDNLIEEIEEDVLIGSYGTGGNKIPRTVDNPFSQKLPSSTP